MKQSYDVAIVGLGAVGSATAYHLARRGRRVLGLDRFSPPHEWGSSHGQTRIIREAYFEHPLYVPLVQRAYELWAELEQEAGRPLFRRTGGLMIGSPEGQLVSGSLLSAQTHQLRHELLTGTEVRRRFPIFQPPDDFAALWEARAGVLFPEACIEAHLELACRHGANLQFEEPVTAWEAVGEGVRLTTPHGQVYADQLLITAGAWLGRLVPQLNLPLTVERQVLYWFEAPPNTSAFRPDRCPIFVWEYEPGHIFYGFPDLGDGIKVAIHHQGESTDPDAPRREVGSAEEAAMRALLSRFVPAADGALLSSAVCMYTNTPDFHFLVDWDPHHPQLLIGSPCSGHGFKFASVMGEILADLLTMGQTRHDISLFGLERLTSGEQAGPAK